MSLRDTACYTLLLIPSLKDPNVLELIEAHQPGNQESRYVRVRERQEGEALSGVIYDSLSGAKLASYGYPNERAKKRRLELHGPEEEVPLESTGRINFEWNFVFESNKYRWSREVYGKDYICALDRKPDPRVEICLARDGDKHSSGRIQILHYNIDRFPTEIKDLRGLETLLIASFMSFVDVADDRHIRPSLGTSTSSSAEPPPKVISEEDFEDRNPNEIIVELDSDLDAHVSRACGLLEDPNMLFIVVRSKTAEASQLALQVSLGVTRFRHRESLNDLHQYVIEQEIPSTAPSPRQNDRPGPKVIKLDDDLPPPSAPLRHGSGNASEWTPPPMLEIYLSTIELPDLKPGRREHLQPTAAASFENPIKISSERKGSGTSNGIARRFRTHS
ncbi:MAG: hypothetical protein TREMPRED_004793 [Tremellales sp. Tagirdzhanova-0007]|nr:MAG: hypothetical protein TREMPRED_004793 [Tremellales sp. Tagirdzhanova-0007]